MAMADVEQDMSEENVEHPAKVEEPVQKEAPVGGGGEKKWPGWPGESVFRILIPAEKVGGLIGRKGELIKRMVEETKSRIKILDVLPGTPERVVMVSAKEEPHSCLPPAINGLLMIHRCLLDGLESGASDATSDVGAKVCTKLLVPASQAGYLIGKQGVTVKSIQEATHCTVRVLGQEDLPILALEDDRVVEVVGDLTSVRRAVETIALHLRRFLVDRSVIPMFEVKMQMANQNGNWNAPTGYYWLAEVFSPLEKQSHHGTSAFGRLAPPSNAQPATSMATQMTQQTQVPLSYADAVIGNGGSNISYIRRASGATVTIQEATDLPGEMTVEISGTASQVQSAQELIQKFIAEASASKQTQNAGPADEGSDSFPDRGSVCAYPPSNPGPGHSEGYVSVYGANCGC